MMEPEPRKLQKKKKTKTKKKPVKNKKDKKKKISKGITVSNNININVTGGNVPKRRRALAPRSTSLQGQRGQGNLHQAARQAEADARAMQGVYEVRSKLTDTDRRVGEFGHRLNLLGTHFFNNMSQQTQQPQDTAIEDMRNEMRGQIDDGFEKLQQGQDGVFQMIETGAGALNKKLNRGFLGITQAQADSNPTTLSEDDDVDREEKIPLGIQTSESPLETKENDQASTTRSRASQKKPQTRSTVSASQKKEDDLSRKYRGLVMRGSYTESQLKTINAMAVQLNRDNPSTKQLTAFFKSEEFEELRAEYKGTLKSLKQKLNLTRKKLNKADKK